MAVTLEELQIKFTAQTSGLSAQLSKLQGGLQGTEKYASRAQQAFSGMFRYAKMFIGLYIGRQLLRIGKESLSMANDAVESENLFAVSMKGMANEARAWSESLAGSLGLNAYELRKNVGMFNTMFLSMGAGTGKAYEMATGLTKLANDMASFYNMSTTEAFDKLRAGITGETEPLKRLGILVDENTVKQYALAEGIATNGDKLTQQQKLFARYAAILAQTADAQGDLARTIDSPANRIRILNAQLDAAKIALGQAFQPIQAAVLPLLLALAKAATIAAQAIAYLLGGLGAYSTKGVVANLITGKTANSTSKLNDNLSKTADAFKKVGGAARKASKAANVGIKAFDEVNKIGSTTGGGGGGGGMDEVDVPDLSGLSQFGQTFQAISQQVRDAADRIRNAWALLQPLLAGIAAAWVTYKLTGDLGIALVAGAFVTGVVAIVNEINRLKDIRLKKAFGDIAIDYSDAARIVNANLNSKTTEMVREVGRSGARVDAALQEFAAASAYTKKVLVVLQLLSLTTGREAFDTALSDLTTHLQASESVTKFVNAYLTPMFQQGDLSYADYLEQKTLLGDRVAGLGLAAGNIQTTITAMVNAAMDDGEVTDTEAKGIRTVLKERVDEQIQATTELRSTLEAMIDADLKAERITDEQATAAKEQVRLLIEYKTTGINALAAQVEALITVGDWNVLALTQAQVDQLVAAVQAEIAASKDLMTAAQADVITNANLILGETTGGDKLIAAVEGVFSGGLARAKAAEAELQKLLEGGINVGGADWLKAIEESRQKYIQAVEYITNGATAEGTFRRAAAELSNLSAESVDNFIQAYKDHVTSGRTQLEESREFLINWAYSFPEELEAQGITLADFIKGIDEGTSTQIAALQNGAMIDAAKNFAPALSAAFNSGELKYPDVMGYVTQVTTLLESVDFSLLSEEAMAGVAGMVGAFNDPSVLAMFGGENPILLALPGLRDLLGDGFSAAGQEALVALQNGIAATAPATTAQFDAAMTLLGQEAMTTLRNSLTTNAITADDYNRIIVAASTGSLADLKAKFSAEGNSAALSLVTALESMIPKVKDAGAKLKNAASSATGGGGNSAFNSIGQDMGSGLVAGIRAKIAAVKKAARELAAAAASAMQAQAEIASPSKVTDEIGQYFGEGFAIGMDRMTRDVMNSAAALSQTAEDAMTGAEVNSSLTTGVTTTLDTSETEQRDARLVSSAVKAVLDKLNITLAVDGHTLGKATIRAINDVQRSTGRILLEM